MWSFDDPPNFKKAVISLFEGSGAGYGTNGDFHWNHARRLVELAQLQPGQTVLDVATGTAPAAIMAAQTVGATGRVVGLDLTFDMLKYGRQNIAAAGLTKLELVVGDAEQLPFNAGSFQVVLCASSLPWFPNLPAALKEFERVVVKGGKVIFSCYGGEWRVATTKILNEVLAAYGKSTIELNERLNTPDKCRQLALKAGFKAVEVRVEEHRIMSRDPHQVYQEMGPKPGGRFRLKLEGINQAELKAAYLARLEQLNLSQPDWNQDYIQFVSAGK
jgi:protein-L-isoaspartate(D-aspartate) O-methyltransferase